MYMRGFYSPIFAEPEVNNCFSIITFFGDGLRLAAILKNRLGDYRVIITSTVTKQHRVFSIITICRGSDSVKLRIQSPV